MRIQTLSTRGGDEQQLFLGAALQFFCDVICPILQLQHILDINDHTHFVRRLSPGRGRDVLGECLCVRELSGHKLI